MADRLEVKLGSPERTVSPESEDKQDTDTATVQDCPATTPTMTMGMTMTTGDIERLLQKQRSEIMYELRHLQHGEKPVSGTEARSNLASFFEHDSSATSRMPEQHRPESVTVEVMGLVERRPVSSALQSTRFRRHLENVVRGSLTSVRTSHHVPVRNGDSASVMSDTSLRSASSSNSTGSADNTGISPPPAAGDVLQQGPLARDPVATWNNMQDLHREQVIEDISELVHRQLVTSSLDSQFRNYLEMHVQNQVQATGTDGHRVQDFIQSLHPTQPVIRNDFSHLGIPSAGDNMADNISIISATATATVHHQINSIMCRDMQALKAQVQELTNMMKVSFDLQMEIQRSIRQEVAAAVAATGLPAPSASQPLSRPVNDTHCLICLDAYADSVLYACGHMCMCHSCGLRLHARGGNCPVCRAPIRDVIRAYRCNPPDDE